MSSVHYSGEASVERDLARIIAEATGSDVEFLNVTLAGRKVIVQGTVCSYAAKARAAETLRLAGCTDVDNCLRVVPGVAGIQ